MAREAAQPSLAFFEPLDLDSLEAGDLYDELPLWSAPFGAMLLDRVPLRRAMTVVDVGCGTGFLAIEIAERSGPDTTVYAVDPWHPAIERLRRKLAYRKLANVVLLEQDAATVDLPDASIDVIVSNLGINNFEAPAVVLANCARMARPGATLILSTNLVGHMQEFYDAYRAVLSDLLLDDLLEDLERHVAGRATVEGVATLLSDAGFEVQSVDTASFRWRFADGSALLRHHFIRLGFLGGWRSFVPDHVQPAVFAALEDRLNRLAADQGELAMTIPMACVAATARPGPRPGAATSTTGQTAPPS